MLTLPCPQKVLIVSVNECASQDDLISNPSQDQDSYCEHEQLNHKESISTPHCPEQLVTPTVNAPASGDDRISDPSPVENGYCEREQLDSLSAPHSQEQILTPTVYEPASEVDLTSHPQQLEDGYCEQEQLNPVESIAAPHSPEQLQDPTVNKPASEVDLISVLSPAADVLVDTMNEIPENENPEGSIAAPQSPKQPAATKQKRKYSIIPPSACRLCQKEIKGQCPACQMKEFKRLLREEDKQLRSVMRHQAKSTRYNCQYKCLKRDSHITFFPKF
ncbi:uncharacterized protein LOC116926923 [Daphnia magna]|nr:uncharacterized protein LOC116926923 [Daphnia magna]